ncbi:MAG: 16S rRNA (cytidine(1402)-2'-O)-methyltransferase [Deltaproteobacteria bacterium]
MPDAGTIYIVSTPIGNLEDITLRAARILGEVDWIAAEDTRRTRILLDHLGLRTRMISYHDATEAQRTPELLERVRDGASIALVSDAGTPLVADPGYRLVKAAAAAGLLVVPIPGASAPLALLAASGLATDRFCFLGFLPAKAGARRDAIEAMRSRTETILVFETARRLPAALRELADLLGPRPAVVGRELTKKYEEILRGDLVSLSAEIGARENLRGEIVLAIGRAESEVSPQDQLLEAGRRLDERLAAGESASRAARVVAEELGLSRRLVYEQAHRKN